jgi:antitoxin ParD1/3/4
MGAKNTSVALGDKLEKFAAEQVASGAYGSVSEVLRAGVRMLAEREAKVEALRQALIEGEKSGSAGEWDLHAFLEERRKAYRNAA